MALTRDFKETVKARADRDPDFRIGLLVEALEAVVRGEPDVAKILLRDYINATVGFESVGKAIGKNSKSVMRMFSPTGNPTLNNFFDVTRFLQKDARVQHTVVSTAIARMSDTKKKVTKKKATARKRELVNAD